MKQRLRDMADIALALVASVLGASLAPGLPFVGLPVAAMALAWLTFRHGPVVSAFVAILASVAGSLLVGGVSELAFTTPALLACGPGAAWVLGRWPAMRTVVLLSAVLFGLSALYLALAAAAEGMSFIALQRAQAQESGRLLVAILKASGSTDASALAEVGTSYARTIFLLWPTGLAYQSVLTAALCVPLVVRMGDATAHPVNRLPRLALVDMSIHVVWPAIAGLGLTAAATFMRRPDGFLWALGVNLLLLARIPLFVQGLGDFAALYGKAKVGRLGRAFGFTFLTVSELVIPSVSIIGLLDMFANLRRLPRAGSTPRPGLESGPGSV